MKNPLKWQDAAGGAVLAALIVYWHQIPLVGFGTIWALSLVPAAAFRLFGEAAKGGGK